MQEERTDVELPPAILNLISGLLGHGLLTAACVMLVLTLAWTAMRVTSRRLGGHIFLPADYIYFAGQVFYIAFVVCVIIQDVIGNKPPETLATSPSLLNGIVNAALASRVAYLLVLVCVKLSIAVLLQRLLSVASKAMNIACWVAIVLTIGWLVWALVAFLAICSPANGTAESGTGCGSIQINFTVVYALDVFTDLILLLLPLKSISGLHMPKAHKLALLLMFSGGLVTMALSAAFLASIWTNGAVSSVVGVVQAGIALMVASSTVLRPLFDATVVRWFNLESLRHSEGDNNISLVTWSGLPDGPREASGNSTKTSARRREQRPQVTESEENLAATGGDGFQKTEQM